jgi:bacteriochlorophyll 4-vinyl reductase
LPCLPERLALRFLLKAVERLAWKFAGLLAWKAMPEGFGLTLPNNPVSRTIGADQPASTGSENALERATFETLFRGPPGPCIRVGETACIAEGDAACVFRVTL